MCEKLPVKNGEKLEMENQSFQTFFMILYSTFFTEKCDEKGKLFITTFFSVNTSEKIKMFSSHFPLGIRVKNVK